MREIGDRRGEGNALGNLGISYKQLGDYERAIEYYELGIAMANAIGDRTGEGHSLWNIALVFDRLGNRSEAISRADAALEIVDAIEPPVALVVRDQLAKWRGEQGKAAKKSS